MPGLGSEYRTYSDCAGAEQQLLLRIVLRRERARFSWRSLGHWASCHETMSMHARSADRIRGSAASSPTASSALVESLASTRVTGASRTHPGTHPAVGQLFGCLHHLGDQSRGHCRDGSTGWDGPLPANRARRHGPSRGRSHTWSGMQVRRAWDSTARSPTTTLRIFPRRGRSGAGCSCGTSGPTAGEGFRFASPGGLFNAMPRL